MSETVLLAEDDPIFRRVLQSRLKSWGYRVILAEDGNQAWKLLQQPNTPDLLILDWIMPGTDGIELCRRLRAMPQERYQYILLLSGRDQKRDVVAGLEAGADDYLTKPFDISELRARLRAGKRILMLQHELIQAREALRFQATHDDLTGLWSHGATLHLLATELQRSIRSHTHTGVLMIDLDHFKSVNDTYGHLTGDVVLRETGRRIHQVVRNYDFVGRYGGEEFMVVLSNCTPDDLRRIADRACGALSETPISTDAGDVNVTISVGGVIGSGEMHAAELLSLADTALYEAKRSGRNRVVIGSCDAIASGKKLSTDSGTQLTSPRIQSN
ncbi:MAG TPA: diguanylate cyclase [Candidatus Sulfotelmatobacter sp.]|nr:diguanylate cyclase [Candidatus Sulfotelmatobacter sp.]